VTVEIREKEESEKQRKFESNRFCEPAKQPFDKLREP
jgi:hypothetical protein